MTGFCHQLEKLLGRPLSSNGVPADQQTDPQAPRLRDEQKRVETPLMRNYRERIEEIRRQSE